MEKIPDKYLQIIPLTKRYDLTSFNSSNAELNDFFINDALKDQENMVSRTYFCCWKKKILGYFALVTDTLEVEAVDKIDEINGYLYRKYPAIKMARLAVDRGFEKRGIGKFMLLAAIGKSISVSNEIGCRYITVDSKPEAVGFYERHGFKIVEKYRHTGTPKMYLNMYPIVAMMQPKESLENFEM